MSLSRMKPLPKFIIIVGLVAGVVVAVKFGLQFMPQKAETPVVEAPVVTAPVANSKPAEAAPTAPTEAVPGLQAAPTDAGVANVLRAIK